MQKQGDQLDIREAISRLDQPEDRWLKGILDAARSKLDRGLGIYAMSYDASDSSDVKYKSFFRSGSGSGPNPRLTPMGGVPLGGTTRQQYQSSFYGRIDQTSTR